MVRLTTEKSLSDWAEDAPVNFSQQWKFSVIFLPKNSSGERPDA